MMLANIDRTFNPEKTLDGLQKYNLKRKQDSLTKKSVSTDCKEAHLTKKQSSEDARPLFNTKK